VLARYERVVGPFLERGAKKGQMFGMPIVKVRDKVDQFTRWQWMNWDYGGRLQKAQIDVADVSADLGFRLPEDASGPTLSAPRPGEAPAS